MTLTHGFQIVMAVPVDEGGTGLRGGRRALDRMKFLGKDRERGR